MTPEFLNLSDSELLHYLAEDWHEQHEGARLEEVAVKFDRMALALKAFESGWLERLRTGKFYIRGHAIMSFPTLEAAIDALEEE